MDASTTNTTLQSDVLHFENHGKLSAEEIAKAVARHNHHHPNHQPESASAKAPAAKKRH
jgi:dTDP-4-dehydrorhamnose reductase